MPFPIQYSIAGIILLCVNLFHFGKQKKLWDQNTRLFLRLILISLVINLLAALQTVFLSSAIPISANGKLIPATFLYLFQFSLPIAFAQYIQTVHQNYIQKYSFSWIITWACLGLGVLLILFNILFRFIAYIDADGFLHRGMFHTLFYCALFCSYLILLFYTWNCKKEKERHANVIISEVLLILMIGMLLQQFLKIALVFGFCAALGITILYLNLNNPYAYVERVTGIFHYRYFRIWMQEQILSHQPMEMIAVELYRLQRIDGMYVSGTGTELIRQICERFTGISPKLKIFRLKQDRFLLCVPAKQPVPDLSGSLKNIFDTGFPVFGRILYCPALFCEIRYPERFSDVTELESYIDFQCDQTFSEEFFSEIPDTSQSRKKFFTETQVLEYLDAAIEQNLFELYYQPVYSCSAGNYVSAEALSRLRIPGIGMVSPELFIRIAEENGKINVLTRNQLKNLCHFLCQNPILLKCLDSVKFNVSPYCLKEPAYLTSLADMIQKEQIPLSSVQFEITESAASDFTGSLKKEMEALSTRGIRFCLDDFGSGYANLNSILQLPVSVIKMDRSLLTNITQRNHEAAFYRDFTHTLIKLGYQVLAEGVEKEEEAALVRAWGIDLIQGFYYGRPLPADQFLACISQKHKR